ncbi:hypothetical protein [Cyclobacterium marinum]|uniref:Uncharacterized protein n=1 Tax=Cyclobacterium marinum (strain ATCC 25205 / DSM 745 / LMG 13164 / NCIMB 1802) TaxID=880070 RepID=G0J635_CYCMS|nr:hypothetical protein [Cyclobacterium marinum]AEL26098.1 hypothetical protein Cycma_2356 [Cyclobacterium marinum DSM 745]|tara:strand:+ start:199 stop:969 length:771 start_codon:yes stop_codon:yes gene_type:complete
MENFSEYTFNDWLDNKPEPRNDLEGIIAPKELKKIFEAKEYTFETSFKLTLEYYKRDFIEDLNKCEIRDKIEIIKEVIPDAQSNFQKFKKRELIKQDYPDKFLGINGHEYNMTKRQEDGLNNGIYGTFSSKINDFHSAVIHYHLYKFYLELLEEHQSPLKIVLLTNIGHKLTLLYELGFIDLINKRFIEENSDKAMSKAKLIGSLLGCDQPNDIETVRKYLSYIENLGHSKSPLTKSSINEVKKILQDCGLTPKNI